MPAERLWAVVPAAGAGRRMGGGRTKQYLPLLDSTVLEQALAVLLGESSIEAVVVALAAGDTVWSTLPVAGEARVRTTEGGRERYDSVCNALQVLAGEAAPQDWVLVHDAARPCLHRADLTALIDAGRQSEAGALLAIPVSDTLKRATGNQVEKTVDRGGLWRALTPQMFRLGELRDALQSAEAAGLRPSDEAQAMEHVGLRPQLVPGRADNIKITEPGDLELAAAILAGRQS